MGRPRAQRAVRTSSGPRVTRPDRFHHRCSSPMELARNRLALRSLAAISSRAELTGRRKSRAVPSHQGLASESPGRVDRRRSVACSLLPRLGSGSKIPTLLKNGSYFSTTSAFIVKDLPATDDDTAPKLCNCIPARRHSLPVAARRHRL